MRTDFSGERLEFLLLVYDYVDVGAQPTSQESPARWRERERQSGVRVGPASSTETRRKESRERRQAAPAKRIDSAPSLTGFVRGSGPAHSLVEGLNDIEGQHGERVRFQGGHALVEDR